LILKITTTIPTIAIQDPTTITTTTQTIQAPKHQLSLIFLILKRLKIEK